VRIKAIEDDLLYFKVHSLLNSDEVLIKKLFRGFTLTETNKFFYTFKKPKIHLLTPKIEQMQFVLIDKSFLQQELVQNLQYVKSEIQWMWPSPETFYSKGFGFAAQIENRIVCWCTAEYVSTKKCGIGIETIQEFRNYGIASSTVSHFVDYCQDHNITPYWECDQDNVASIRVAENVGFERVQESKFWAGTFKKTN
jgi:predicted acetyltransferase